jgi:cell division protein FtsQ
MRRRGAVLFLLLITGLVVAVYALRIDQIRVAGVQSLSAHDIVKASGIEPGERILWVRLSAAERRIERIPAVADAVAERSLPDTVVIHVRERVPLARLDGARTLVTDDEGVVFAARDRIVEPVLYGWKGAKREGTRLDARSRKVLAAYPRFPSFLRQRARKIIVAPSIVLTLRGGTQVRFGSTNDLEAKAQTAVAVLRAEHGHKIEYVDVRSPSVPVAKERVPPTPSPTPAPVPAAPVAPAPSSATPAPLSPTPAPASPRGAATPSSPR